jgi:hypothetical protein
MRVSPLGSVTRGRVPRSRSSAKMVELPVPLVASWGKEMDGRTWRLALELLERLAGEVVGIVFVDAEIDILRAQQIYQIQHRLAPGPRCQLSLLLVQRCGDKHLFVAGVGAAGQGAAERALAQLLVVSRRIGIGREDDADEQNEEEADKRYGEEAMIDETQQRSFSPPDGDIVRVRLRVRNLPDTKRQRAGYATEPRRVRGLSRQLRGAIRVDRGTREQLIVVVDAGPASGHFIEADAVVDRRRGAGRNYGSARMCQGTAIAIYPKSESSGFRCRYLRTR